MSKPAETDHVIHISDIELLNIKVLRTFLFKVVICTMKTGGFAMKILAQEFYSVPRYVLRCLQKQNNNNKERRDMCKTINRTLNFDFLHAIATFCIFRSKLDKSLHKVLQNLNEKKRLGYWSSVRFVVLIQL